MSTKIPNGITAPKGFVASGVMAGIKKRKKDLALIVSRVPAKAAGLFTTNKVKAAPVQYDIDQLQIGNLISAIIANSGNANACTGQQGYDDVIMTARTLSSVLNIPETSVLVSSTGVIGQFLPLEKIIEAIPLAVKQLRDDGSSEAAQAIMTTDTRKKENAAEIEIGGTAVRIGCISKGSGMIAPVMGPPHATLLAFVTTDASISKSALQKALLAANEVSLNSVTVDGDTSTNDMLLILANGLAGNKEIQEGTKEYSAFLSALTSLLIDQAKMIARDGEGATKLVELTIKGARTEDEAKTAAKTIANSCLVKTAINGADANWGRIICALGYSGIDFLPENTEIFFNDLQILGRNYFAGFSEAKAKEILLQENIFVTVNLNQGPASTTMWTCDLSHEYVSINASYRS